MRNLVRASLAGLLLLGAVPASSEGPVDPDWPCVQRRVERLSLGVMWPHPVPEEAAPLSPELEDVAARVALRRVSEEEARDLLAAVAADDPGLGVEGWGRLFRSAFERIDGQRSEIMDGIARYARSQAQLAAELDELRAEMARLEAAPRPDHDRMDAVEEAIDWSVRIFGDRNRALTFVCESPVLLEQRAYAVAQMMLELAG